MYVTTEDLRQFKLGICPVDVHPMNHINVYDVAACSFAE